MKIFLKIGMITAGVMLLSVSMKAQITLARQALSSYGVLYQTPSPGMDIMSTAGESFIETLGGGLLKLALTQGIQQPDNIFQTAIDPLSGLPFEFKAYPNPTADKLTISLEGKFNRKIEVQLYDIQGRIIPSLKAEFWHSGEAVWEVSNLAEGMYMIRLMDQNGKLLITEPILKR